jgi:hypothetical protein
MTTRSTPKKYFKEKILHPANNEDKTNNCPKIGQSLRKAFFKLLE